MSKYSKNYNQALYYKGKRIMEIHSPNYLRYFADAVRNICNYYMSEKDYYIVSYNEEQDKKDPEVFLKDLDNCY